MMRPLINTVYEKIVQIIANIVFEMIRLLPCFALFSALSYSAFLFLIMRVSIVKPIMS